MYFECGRCTQVFVNIAARSHKDADTHINYDILELTITDAANKHLPTKTIKVNKHKHKKSKWITYDIIKSIKFRDRLYMKLKKTAANTLAHDAVSINIKTYNKILKTSIRVAKGNCYHARFELCKHDIKAKVSKNIQRYTPITVDQTAPFQTR